MDKAGNKDVGTPTTAYNNQIIDQRVADKETLSNAPGLRGTAGTKGSFAKFPFAHTAPGDEQVSADDSQAAGDAPQSAADAPDAKPVPEADTWMLLAVVFGIFGGAAVVNQMKRRAKKA